MHQRLPVRLGEHASEYIFERAIGLRGDATGITVVGSDPHDPELLFEEHAMGTTCEYFKLLADDVEFDEQYGPQAGRPDIAKRVTSDHWPTRFHALQAAFFLERTDAVNTMLSTMRSDLAASGGAVFVIGTSQRLQMRKAMIRVQHAAQAQPDRDINDLLGDPHPLEEHSAGSDGLHHYLYSPIVLLASPFVRGFTASRLISERAEMYTLVVLCPPGRGAPFDQDEVSWETVFHSGLPSLRNHALAGLDWLTELNAPAAHIPAVELVRWWTGQLNELLTEATDLGRYRAEDWLFDARNAYRELRTLDRIIANCIRIQANAEDHVGRIAAAFEFFDLLPNLLVGDVAPRKIWASLADPSRALKIFDAAFARTPDAIRSVLRDRAALVADTLRAETMAAVVPERASARGVLVGNGAPPVQPDIYVAKLLHQLRNTHHGYELTYQNQRDLLDSHTGHISVAFPELVVLYVLALVADPSAALGGDWLGT